MLLKLLPFPTKSEQDNFFSLSRYIHGYMRKQNAVIILKFDYRYITKVCIHTFLSLKLPFVLNVNKTYKIVLLLSENTDFLLVHVRLGKGLKFHL